MEVQKFISIAPWTMIFQLINLLILMVAFKKYLFKPVLAILEKRREEIERLPEIQYAILSNCARYVKPGGRLYYTTCTLNRAENQAVAERFLSESAAFEPIRFDAGGIRGEDGMLTLMPQLHGTDGFFISGFRKKYE